MPLAPNTISLITDYYRRDIGCYSNYIERFDFVDDLELKKRLAQEFYIARYIAKLQEAMNFDENSFEMLGNLKFQIVQYAGIFEAVISYLLNQQFSNDINVEKLGKRTEYRKVDALSGNTTIQFDGENVFVCKQVSVKDDWIHIRFEDKVKAAKKIGFISEKISKVILSTYKLRHSVHVEKAVKSEISFEIEQARLAYETLFTFLSDIKKFLNK